MSSRQLRIIDLLAAQTAVALTITIHSDKVYGQYDSIWIQCLLVVWIALVLFPAEILIYLYLFARFLEVTDGRPTECSPPRGRTLPDDQRFL